ncbi:hypothetical protein [Morganella psychrotolerans]|uniref:hypothetical protein n=1 Tax=Morganella psychrotolerans TaxID=368603 RepID=UPI0039AFA10A
MKNIIILASCITISIFIYKKTNSYFLANAYSSIKSSLLSILSFIVSLIILVILSISIFSNKPEKLKNIPSIKWSISTDQKVINKIINNDLKYNEQLTRRILNEIHSYKEDSDDRFLAEMVYITYGVGSNEFNSILKKTACYNNYSRNIKDIGLYHKNEISSWLPYNEFKRTVGGGDILQAEMNYREQYNKSYLDRVNATNDKFSICQWKTAQSMNEHLIRDNKK